MRVDHWLEDALGSPMRVRVLRYLVQSPRTEHTLRDVGRALGVGPSTARVALLALADLGLVESKRLGRSDGYRLRMGTTKRLLESIFEAEVALRQEAIRAMRRAGRGDATVLIFGSGARGEQASASDLDILVVATDQRRAASMAERLRDALERVGPLRPRILELDAESLRQKKGLGWIRNAQREGTLVAGPPLEKWA